VRRRLAAIAERAIEAAGASGVLPTPLEDVQRVAGIRERRDIGELPPALAVSGRRLLGALWFEPMAVYVDLSQPLPRRRFTDAHEAMHALCPWHEAVLREDTEHELFRATRATIEAEANVGAGLLIFQGDRFRTRVAGAPCSIAAAQALAEEHGASLQATLHHHVELHDGPAALVVTGRYPQRDGSLPVWGSTQSASFHRRHGPVARHVGGRVGDGTPLRAVIEAARVGATSARALRLGGAGAHRFDVEAFYNRHTFLVLLTGRSARRLSGGRRAESCPTTSAAGRPRARTPSAP